MAQIDWDKELENYRGNVSTQEQPISAQPVSTKSGLIDWDKELAGFKQQKQQEIIPKQSSIIDKARDYVNKNVVLKTLLKNPLGLATQPAMNVARGGDVLVENVAKFIEPKSVPANANLLDAAGFMARQMPADFVIGYKPSSVVPFMLGAKALGVVGKPAGKAIWNKLPKNVKTFLTRNSTVGRGQPEAYQALKEQNVLAKELGKEEAEKVGKILSVKPTGEKFSTPEKLYLGRMVRGEVAKSPALLDQPKYLELKQSADEGRVIIDKWTKNLVKSGIPKEQVSQTLEENLGQYLPRKFTTKLAEKYASQYGYSPKNVRLQLQNLKHRKDLSSEVLDKLGWIKEPALPAQMHVRVQSQNIANNELFNKVAQNPEWSNVAPIGKGWIKMPDNPQVGALRGKWVEPTIGEDINGILNSTTEANKFYNKILSAWKYSKTVLNPATHSKNIISNTMLLDLSGVNHARQAQLFPTVIKEYLSKGAFFKEAKQLGLLRKGFYDSEAKLFLENYASSVDPSMLGKLVNFANKPLKELGNIYQFEEEFFKMMKFVDMRSKGFIPDVAAKEATKWLFDYNKVPKFIDILRKSPYGSPFITFTYKAIPRIAETLINNPLKIYKYQSLFNAFNNASGRMLNLSPQQIKEEVDNLPSYMSKSILGTPANLLMPLKDKTGRTQYLNLEYILPVGIAPEMIDRGMGGIVSNPFFNILSSIQTNKDFTGRDIVKLGSDPLQANLKRAEYIWKQLVPTLAPGGYSWNKIESTLKGRGDYAGRLRDPQQVLFDVLFGLKITPVNIKEQKYFNAIKKYSDIKSITKELRKVQSNKGMLEEEKQSTKEDAIKRFINVLKK